MIRGPARGKRARGITPRPAGRPVGSMDRMGKAILITAGPLHARQLVIARGIAIRLSSILDEQSVSASELAEAVGVSQYTVYNHLSGNATPSLWTMVAYAAALRCSLVDLMPDEAHLP